MSESKPKVFVASATPADMMTIKNRVRDTALAMFRSTQGRASMDLGAIVTLAYLVGQLDVLSFVAKGHPELTLPDLTLPVIPDGDPELHFFNSSEQQN